MAENKLAHFAGHNLTEEQFNEVMENFTKEDLNKYQIPCEGGYLRVLVEDGVPKITYHTDGRVVVEMLSSNSLRLISVERK